MMARRPEAVLPRLTKKKRWEPQPARTEARRKRPPRHLRTFEALAEVRHQ